jgi:hypothetical protein
MFRTYVRALHERPVNFDRAARLMDRELLAEAKALRKGETRSPREPDTMAQRVWNTHCALHREKYASDFQPDVDETWDVPAGPQLEAAWLAILAETARALAEEAGAPDPDANPYAGANIRISHARPNMGKRRKRTHGRMPAILRDRSEYIRRLVPSTILDEEAGAAKPDADNPYVPINIRVGHRFRIEHGVLAANPVPRELAHVSAVDGIVTRLAEHADRIAAAHLEHLDRLNEMSLPALVLCGGSEHDGTAAGESGEKISGVALLRIEFGPRRAELCRVFDDQDRAALA